MKTFNRVDCIKWSIIGLILGVSIILATSCSRSSARRHNTMVATIKPTEVTIVKPDTVFQCSVTGYLDGSVQIQKSELYYKCSSAACLKALDDIAGEFYQQCDSVVIYKQKLNTIDIE